MVLANNEVFTSVVRWVTIYVMNLCSFWERFAKRFLGGNNVQIRSFPANCFELVPAGSGMRFCFHVRCRFRNNRC